MDVKEPNQHWCMGSTQMLVDTWSQVGGPKRGK